MERSSCDEMLVFTGEAKMHQKRGMAVIDLAMLL